MIYLYAVIDDPRPELGGLTGRDGRELVAFASGPLAAVGERVEAPGPAPAAGGASPATGEMLAHYRVLRHLGERFDLAPCRYGTAFEDAHGVTAALASGLDGLAATLRRLRGRVELAVRAATTGDQTPPPPVAAPGPASPGRSYLARLRSGASAAYGATLIPPLGTIHAALAERAVDSCLDGAGRSFKASYLVGAGDVPACREAIADLGRAHPQTALSMTGPWPAFSFCGQPLGSLGLEAV